MTEYLQDFHATYCVEGQDFRETYLLKTLIDNCMFNNKKAFEHLYKSCMTGVLERLFRKESASSALSKLGISLQESLITYCWGMCKLVNKDDESKQKSYLSLSFIEFLEFLSRAFYLRYKLTFDNISDVNQQDYLLLNKLI